MKLYNPHTAIETLASDIQYIAENQSHYVKGDLANWDNLPESRKRYLVERFSVAKDMTNINDMWNDPMPIAHIYGFQGYDYIVANRILR